MRSEIRSNVGVQMSQATTTREQGQQLNLGDLQIQGDGAAFAVTPIPGAIRQAEDGRIERSDASLDYVLAEAQWSKAPNSLAIVREWRRVLREGGRCIVLVDTRSLDAQLAASMIATEVGASIDSVDQLSDACARIEATRSYAKSLRRCFGFVGREIESGRELEGWRSEFSFDLGSCLLQVGEGRLALDCFRRALRDDEDNLEARVGCALALMLEADYDEATAMLGEVLSVDPDHGLAAEWLARCHVGKRADDDDPTVLQPQSSLRSKR